MCKSHGLTFERTRRQATIMAECTALVSLIWRGLPVLQERRRSIEGTNYGFGPLTTVLAAASR